MKLSGWGSMICAVLAADLTLAQPSGAPSGEPVEPPPRLIVLVVESSGVDRVLERFTERALLTQARAAGYEALGTEKGSHALAQQGAGSPPSLADLWRATRLAGATHGVRAKISAQSGRYTIALLLASSDGSGPYETAASAGAGDFERAVSGALAELLARALHATFPDAPAGPPVPVRSVEASAPTQVSSAPALKAAAAVPKPRLRFFEQSEPEPPQPPRLRLALHNDVAIGMASGGFVNDVLGARFDYRFGEAFWLGPALGYANLEGRDGRVSSVLLYLQAEQRVALGPWLGLPLRMGLGYLLRNGGLVRLSSGLSFDLYERAQLTLDLLAPTFWATPSRTLFSLDFAAEVSVEL